MTCGVYGELVLSLQCSACAVLAELNSINRITLIMSECFVPRMDKFLPQPVARFEADRDVTFIQEPPEHVVAFSRLLVSSSLSALNLLEVLTKVQFG